MQKCSALISESLASFAVFSHPQVLLYGLAEERNGCLTPALLAASTGSLPAEASGGLNSSPESKGGNQCSTGDHKSRTQLRYFCWVNFTALNFC